MSPRSSWHSLDERGSLLGMRFVVSLQRVFGRRAVGVLLPPIVAYFFLTGGAARRASRLYLSRLRAWSGGRAPMGRGPSWWHGFRHFREFGTNIMDRVGFLLGESRAVDIVLYGREHLLRLRDEGRGGIILSAHLGSFDILRLYAGREEAPVTFLMFMEHARMINLIFRRLNSDIELRTITPGLDGFGWVFDVRARVARGELVGMLADRVGPAEGHRVSWVSFLGTPAPFSQGPFLLARTLKVPLLTLFALRVGSRRYEVLIEPIDHGNGGAASTDQPVDGLIETYVQRLERACERAPYQWFNFFDFWTGGGGEADRSSPARRLGWATARPGAPAR